MNYFKERSKLIGVAIVLFLFVILITGIFGGKTKTNNKKPAEVKSAQTEAAAPAISDSPAVSILSDKQPAEVLKVIDGDTIAVSINGQKQTIRIIGINTPETVDPRKTVECFGAEASNKAKEYFKDMEYKVWLKEDSTQGDKDKYQRLLRYVFTDDGSQDYGLQMIKDGYAYEYTYNTPYKYQDEYKKAQADAQIKKLGLWADDACSQINQLQISNDKSTNIKQGSRIIEEDRDCLDFKTQKEAQDFFISQGGPASDPHKLDQDKDGVACESLP